MHAGQQRRDSRMQRRVGLLSRMCSSEEEIVDFEIGLISDGPVVLERRLRDV
jgi:hypothetical protein